MSSNEQSNSQGDAAPTTALALRAADIRRDALVLPNCKYPSRPEKTVFLPAGDLDLPSELLLWQKRQRLEDDEPLFSSHERGPAGERWTISGV